MTTEQCHSEKFMNLLDGESFMKMSAPVDIMLDCCIPDKKKLMSELSKLSPGETIQIKIDTCISSRAMVESYLKNKWCRIEKTEEQEDSSILHIRLM